MLKTSSLALAAVTALSLLSAVNSATVSLTWTITNTTQALDGVSRFALGINGQPGHLTPIHVNTGDRLIITVKNGLNKPTALHWHGLFQNTTAFMDGPVGATNCAIAPGDTFIYNFTTAGQEGTFWWHGHYKAQYLDGLRGPLIISNPKNPLESQYANDITVQLADWYHDQSDNLLAWYLNGALNPDGNEPVFQSALINGVGRFNCSDTTMPCKAIPYNRFQLTKGAATRFRVVNVAAFAGFTFGIDGHKLRVVEVDGIQVEPYVVDEISVNVAQRYSVLVTADQPTKSYWMRATMYHGAPWTSAPDPMGLNATTLAVVDYSPATPNSPLPTSKALANPKTLDDMQLIPVERILPPTPGSNDVELVFSFDFDAKGDDTYQRAYPVVRPALTPASPVTIPVVNGSYVSPDYPTLMSIAAKKQNVSSLPATSNVVSIPHMAVVQLTIVNFDGGEHPFHLHGHVFWVMAKGIATRASDVPTTFKNTNPLRRDVVTVQACPVDDATGECLAATDGSGDSQFGYTIIRFRADNPGVWLFHCHIEWHIVAGLVMQFVEAADVLQARGLPAAPLSTCANLNAWQQKTH
ncbi:hypothetical protein HK101_003633 [Irineochytrium annulatum]|nr:hypothetical protein HK101_003633 [Irineochytrium annulatum]